MITQTTERADLMPDPDEKTMMSMYDRLRTVETKQEVFEAKYLAALQAIDSKLSAISQGQNPNCLVHKAELDTARAAHDRLADDFTNYKADQLKVSEKHEAQLQHRVYLIWAALISGSASLLWKLLPWIAKAVIANGGKL